MWCLITPPPKIIIPDFNDLIAIEFNLLISEKNLVKNTSFQPDDISVFYQMQYPRSNQDF